MLLPTESSLRPPNAQIYEYESFMNIQSLAVKMAGNGCSLESECGCSAHRQILGWANASIGLKMYEKENAVSERLG